MEPLDLANEVIGSGFLSRLNMDLREDKGWTYGIRSSLAGVAGTRWLDVVTPVQSDRTADSIRLILDQMTQFASGAKGVDATELQRVTDGNIRGLPNSYQTNSQVLGALLNNQLFGRPDDYQRRLPGIIRAIDAARIDAAAQQYLAPDQLAIIVVGDRKQIDDQLATLGMEIEYLSAEAL
jgi:zinc protease